MSFINHFRRHKHDEKSGSSSRDVSAEPRPIPRIVTTTDAPSIVSRDIMKPQLSRSATQERNVSASSAASGSTIAAEENHHNQTGVVERTKSAAVSRAVSPSPPTSRDSNNRRSIAPRGNHIVTDAVFTFRPKLETELKGTKEVALAEGVSSEALLIFISNDRLRRMPARGSRWDKILKWSEDFTKKLALFEVTDESFIPSSKEAVELICASIQLLLLVGLRTLLPPAFMTHKTWGATANMHEQRSLANTFSPPQLGPQNGEALERAFGVFHDYSQVFSFYRKNISLLYSITEARRYLSLSLADMLGECFLSCPSIGVCLILTDTVLQACPLT